MNDMRVQIRGRSWLLREVGPNEMQHSGDNPRGECDPPDAKRKEIRILKGMGDKEKLEVVLHEMIHAAAWDWAEEAVEETAHDMARVLYRLGWRQT